MMRSPITPVLRDLARVSRAAPRTLIQVVPEALQEVVDFIEAVRRLGHPMVFPRPPDLGFSLGELPTGARLEVGLLLRRDR